MGTHLSAYIEIDFGRSAEPFSEQGQIFSLTEGSFVFDKDYEVFNALGAGREARMPAEDRDPRNDPLFRPRGLPFPCSPSVAWDFFHLIAEPPQLPQYPFWPPWRCVSADTASKWIRMSGSREVEFLQDVNLDSPGFWSAVSDPDLYNDSWLMLSEFDAALAHHRLELAALPVEYRIVGYAMASLAERHGESRVRLVFWFS